MHLITHIPDLTLFKSVCAEIVGTDNPLAKYLYIDDNDSVQFRINKIPVHYNDNETLCLIVVTETEKQEINGFGGITFLGECKEREYIYNSPEDKATYDRVRGDLTVNYIDDDGVNQTYQLPVMIGVIA